MFRTAVAALMVAAGVAVPATAAAAAPTAGAGCTQEHWRTVAMVATWDASPEFDVDGEQRFYGRVDTAVVRKKCGEAKVVLREGSWELLDPATAVETGSSESMTPRCGSRQKWRHAITLRSPDVTPDFATEEGERHFRRGERWIVREKCGAYDLRRRTSDWVLVAD